MVLYVELPCRHQNLASLWLERRFVRQRAFNLEPVVCDHPNREITMKRAFRALSGGCVGAATLVIVGAASPARAEVTDGLFCSETANYITCCITRDDGTIEGCIARKKGDTGLPQA